MKLSLSKRIKCFLSTLCQTNKKHNNHWPFLDFCLRKHCQGDFMIIVMSLFLQSSIFKLLQVPLLWKTPFSWQISFQKKNKNLVYLVITSMLSYECYKTVAKPSGTVLFFWGNMGLWSFKWQVDLPLKVFPWSW